MEAILFLILIAVGLLCVGLASLREGDPVTSAPPVNMVRFWLGISALALALAISALFLYALLFAS